MIALQPFTGGSYDLRELGDTSDIHPSNSPLSVEAAPVYQPRRDDLGINDRGLTVFCVPRAGMRSFPITVIVRASPLDLRSSTPGRRHESLINSAQTGLAAYSLDAHGAEIV